MFGLIEEIEEIIKCQACKSTSSLISFQCENGCELVCERCTDASDSAECIINICGPSEQILHIMKVIESRKESRAYKADKFLQKNQKNICAFAIFSVGLYLCHNIGFSSVVLSSVFWTPFTILAAGFVGGIIGVVSSFDSVIEDLKKTRNPFEALAKVLFMICGLYMAGGFFVGCGAGLFVGFVSTLIANVILGNSVIAAIEGSKLLHAFLKDWSTPSESCGHALIRM